MRKSTGDGRRFAATSWLRSHEASVGDEMLSVQSPDDPLESGQTGISGGWFRALVEHGSDAMIGIDAGHRIQVWNTAAVEMFGYREAEITGRPLSLLLPEGARHGHDGFVRSFASGDRDRRAMGQGSELTARRKDGEEFPVEIAISKISLEDDVMLMASVRDMTNQRNTEKDLAVSNAELRSILKAIPDSVCRLTADGTFIEVIPGSGGGVPLTAEVVGRNICEVLPEDLAARCVHAIDRVFEHDMVVPVMFEETDFGTGGSRSFESRHARLGDDQVIAVVRDVTSRKKAEAELERSAMHDALTGLANRALFTDRLEQALRRSARDGGIVAVFLLDLDHFKNVNDRLGHDAGDRLLMAVTRRLTEGARASDTVARLGGDEFIVLAEGLDDTSAVFTLAERISHALRAPVKFANHEAHVATSMGIAVSIDGNHDATTMLRHADTAMYHAKDLGRDRIEVFDETLQSALEYRVEIEAALRHALDNDEFEIHYQPIIDLASGAMSGVEALLRWDRPGHGQVSPVDFIPIAEDMGLIGELGASVLRRACDQAVTWQADQNRPLNMAVNVSARQLIDPGFSDLVAEVIAGVDLDPRTLSIEVTETALIERREIAICNLEAIRRLGVHVALDDFGTGYASLSYLRSLPITHIKIDRTFTAGLTSDADDATIVESTIALAHGLGRSVIAEGVETADQLELLKGFRCDYAQGFHLGHPQTAGEITRRLRSENPRVHPSGSG